MRCRECSLIIWVGILCVGLNISAQDFQRPDPNRWYRLITRYNGSDERVGRCIQYFPSDSEHPDMLWSATPVDTTLAESDYQFWRFEPSPDDPDRYAMICKAAPHGYVDDVPTALDPSGRWIYVSESESASPDNKYGFIFVTSPTLSGVDSGTGYSYCAISTDASMASGYHYMNAGGPKQDYAINIWYETYSEDANEWSFAFAPRDGDGTSSICDVMCAPSDDEPIVCYDLSGRRVYHPTHGIYIINGRKILLR